MPFVGVDWTAQDREQWRAHVANVVNTVSGGESLDKKILSRALLCIVTKTCKNERVIFGPFILNARWERERGIFS
jgi:hypothetical protein